MSSNVREGGDGKRATSKADTEVMQSSKLEKPVEVVGEHVKSGQKILADYDQATGAVQMRPKFKEYAELVIAAVEEEREYQERQSKAGPKDSKEELAALEKQRKRIAEEEKKLAKGKKEAAGGDLLATLKGSKVDPAVLVMLQQQQQMIESLKAQMKQTSDDAEAAKASRTHSLIEEAKRESRKHQNRLADDLEFWKANEGKGCPPPPKKNPRFGDKTPAYVDWLREWRPEVYEDRYGIQDWDKTLSKADGEGIIRTFKADVSRRKIHRSRKVESDPALASDMDWNA